jgi:hypothetical protein
VAENETPRPQQRAFFSFEFFNFGNQPATGARVALSGGPDTTFFGGTVPLVNQGGQTFLDVGSVPAQSTRTIIFRASSTTVGLKTVNISAQATETDGNSLNNSATTSFTVVAPPTGLFDFGDAPSIYRTRTAEDGPRHLIVANGPFLGQLIDGEADGNPSSFALGDDDTGSRDEDGVEFSGKIDGVGSVIVTVSKACNLQFWIDVNRNGQFDDQEEAVSNPDDFPGMKPFFLSAGRNQIPFLIPPSFNGSGTTYARFRVSSQTGLAPFGPASDGEVEDYTVMLGTPPAAPRLIWNFQNGQANLSWPGDFFIQTAPTVNGPWTPRNWSSPFILGPSPQNIFMELKSAPPY